MNSLAFKTNFGWISVFEYNNQIVKIKFGKCSINLSIQSVVNITMINNPCIGALINALPMRVAPKNSEISCYPLLPPIVGGSTSISSSPRL